MMKIYQLHSDLHYYLLQNIDQQQQTMFYDAEV